MSILQIHIEALFLEEIPRTLFSFVTLGAKLSEIVI